VLFVVDLVGQLLYRLLNLFAVADLCDLVEHELLVELHPLLPFLRLRSTCRPYPVAR